MVDTASALDAIAFNGDGLVAVIAQQHDTGEVLMMAWMNRAAVEETLRSGRVCYYSRSRKALWRKGETSGQTQRLVEFLVDCDGDTVLLKVDQVGVACHTGHRACFFRSLGADGFTEIAPVVVPPETLYGS
jgi:phosphoribosyl-AMP cyclohydrolase